MGSNAEVADLLLRESLRSPARTVLGTSTPDALSGGLTAVAGAGTQVPLGLLRPHSTVSKCGIFHAESSEDGMSFLLSP